MTSCTNLLAAAAILLVAPLAAAAAPRPTPAPCALVSLDQIKAFLGTSVLPGKSSENACTWNDAHGETRVYLSVKDAATDYKAFRDSMQATGRLVPISGLSEDAFYVSATGSSAALYFLKAHHLMLLTVDGIGFSKAQNEAAERGLATQILPKV